MDSYDTHHGDTSTPADQTPAHIVFVCTANQCRSPMAEALLRARLVKAGLSEAVAVSSAGMYEGGRSATPEAAEAVAELGADLATHRSRAIDGGIVDSADVLIAMTRDHAREAIVLRPAAQGRVFTFKEIVRRAEAVGPRRAGETLDGYVARLGAGRDTSAMLGRSSDDDIADPVGNPIGVYRKTAAKLDDLAARLVAYLFAP